MKAGALAMIQPIILGMLLLAPLAQAQQAPPFQSSGIRATIVSTTVTKSGQVILQMLLQNVTDKDVDVVAVKYTEASAANGAIYRLSKVSGLTSCGVTSGAQDERHQVLGCASNAKNDDYTRMAPNTPVVTLLTFTKRSREIGEGSISFALRFLAKASQGSSDVLQDQADAPSRHGPPHVVMISFPLIPLTSQ